MLTTPTRLDTRSSHHSAPKKSWLLQKKASSWSLLSSFSNKKKKENGSDHLIPTITTIIVTDDDTLSGSAVSDTSSIEDDDDDMEESSIIINIPHQEEQENVPPSYEDPSHPWMFQFPPSLKHRIVIPREEEGKEVLPDYECTVDRMMSMQVKCEFSSPGTKSKNRSWRDMYMVVYGTKIMAFNRNPQKNPKKSMEPVWSHSLQGAEAIIPTDYIKHNHVIRLKIAQGPQYLFSVMTEKIKYDWIDTIESSIHISSDLDVRFMPQFTTLISRRRNRRRPRPQQTTVTTEALV